MYRFLQTVSIASLAMCVLMASTGVSVAQEAAVNPETSEKISTIIRSTSEKVRSILKSPDYEKPEKRSALRIQIREVFLQVSDMQRISLLTLGMNRRQFDDEQFQAFIDVFSRLLFTTYITHLERSPDQDLAIQKYVRVSPTRTQVQTLTTKARPADKEIPIYFNFFEKDGEFFIDDLTVEGVSMVLNYRSQFNELLGRMNPTDFLAHLRQRAEEIEKTEVLDNDEDSPESE